MDATQQAASIDTKSAWHYSVRMPTNSYSASGPRKQVLPQLRDWAHFPKGTEGALKPWSGFVVAIEKLREFALKEPWEFGRQPHPDYPSPILRSYMRWTFARLWRERKVRIEGNQAAFNTGLVDHRYEAIYAMFAKNDANPGRQPYYLLGFCIAGEDTLGKDLVRHFKPLPEPPHYFNDPRDMFYDLRAGAPSVDWQHVIIENVDRLPEAFLSDNCPRGFQLKRRTDLKTDEVRPYHEELAKAIEADSRAYRALKNRLDDALQLALKRVRWNFKTAIPQYYPVRDEMSLLLPMALVSDEDTDLALVVERTRSGNYLGHTVLPLDWAYNNARLVCRPLSDWLIPDRITETTVEDSDELPDTTTINTSQQTAQVKTPAPTVAN